MIKLAWVLPTVLAVLAVEVSFRTGMAIPIPFLIIVVCVVIAGSMGGQRSGLISGLIASLFVFNSYLVGFGPATLTGSLLQVALGSVFHASGHIAWATTRTTRYRHTSAA
ncbi:hypothetical protein [Falsihalocynthiibacter arcticus]|uniref:hypothetical protein n=1 Tax=Falsihalocynthiibacter arcticus TaxID=1579316 RepID=UPI00300201DE